MSRIEYPNDAKSLKVMLIASSQEVTRLSTTVDLQQARLRQAEQDRDDWKRRFDRLLDCCRSVS